MDNNSNNNDSNDNATVANDSFLATLPVLRNRLNYRFTDVVTRNPVSVRDASSTSEWIHCASHCAYKAFQTHTAVHQVIST